MKIAGIAGGKNRGNIVELTEEKKIKSAVGAGLVFWANSFKEGKYLAFGTDVDIKTQSSSPHGNPLKKLWANNVYRAKGTLILHLRDKAKDICLEAKPKDFEIEFYDCLDSLGMPDVDVKHLTLK